MHMRHMHMYIIIIALLSFFIDAFCLSSRFVSLFWRGHSSAVSAICQALFLRFIIFYKSSCPHPHRACSLFTINYSSFIIHWRRPQTVPLCLPLHLVGNGFIRSACHGLVGSSRSGWRKKRIGISVKALLKCLPLRSLRGRCHLWWRMRCYYICGVSRHINYSLFIIHYSLKLKIHCMNF